MKNRICFLILVLCAILHSELRADHFMGGEITYETISLDRIRGIFRVTLRLERPCNTQNKFSPDYPIKVIEYDSMRNPAYNFSVYTAKLVDSQYIYYPCTSPIYTCASSNGQIIEVKYYSVDIVVKNSSRECLVYFDDYANRSYSDNLLDIDDPLVLYVSFLPNYVNRQYKLIESKRHFPLKGKLATVNYLHEDIESDSISFRTSVPFKSLSYSLGAHLNYTLAKCRMKIGLHDNRPFQIQESMISKTQNTIQFTPEVEQKSWLTLVKSEFRKVTIANKDTWICISRANTDRLFSIHHIVSEFRLDTILSTSNTVKTDTNKITICNDANPNTLTFRFPIEKSIEVSSYRIHLGTNDITQQCTSTRTTGIGTIDTIVLQYIAHHTNAIDLHTILQFDFDLCHSGQGVGFDRRIQIPYRVFHYKLFASDTILSCHSTLTIPTMIAKPITTSLGVYNIGTQSIVISLPKDTWLYAYLSQPISLCPSRDSIYINQGSIFTTETQGYSPTCFGYVDASAKVRVTGSNGPFTYRWSNSATLDSISSIGSGQHIVEIRDKDNCLQYDTIVIPEPEGIDGEWIIDEAITCYGGQNGRGHIKINSSLKPSQYLWTHPIAVDSFLSNLSADYYHGYYTYTNLANKVCQQNFRFTIPQPDSIYLHIATADNTCFGDAKGKIAVLPVGGQGDFLFYFDQIETLQGYKDGLPNGTVEVYVKDGQGCLSSKRQVIIRSPERLAYNLFVENPSCPGIENGKLIIHHPTGGKTPYLYSVTGTEFSFTNSFSYLAPGFYTIKMKDANDCIFSQNMTLRNDYILNAKLDVLEHSACPLSQTGKIHLELTNGYSPYIIFRSSEDSFIQAASKVELNQLAKGHYDIKIKDDKGCEWSSQYSIDEPDTIRMTTIISHPPCYGVPNGRINVDINSGGTAPYSSLRWYDASHALIPYNYNLNPGRYYLQFQDNKNCQYEYAFEIKGQEKIVPNLKVKEPILCHGYATGSLSALADGGQAPYTFHWRNFPLIAGNVLQNIPSGWYHLELKDAANCIAYDSIQLVEPQPIRLEDMKVRNTDCPNKANGALSLLCINSQGYNSGLRYKLKNKTDYSVSPHFTNLEKGQYLIVVSDSAGCEKEFQGEIDINKDIKVNLPSPQNIEIGEKRMIAPELVLGAGTELSDIHQLVWSPAYSLSCSDCMQPTYTAAKSDTYSIDIHYGNGCKSSASVYFNVSKPEDVFIPNSFSPNDDNKNDVWYVYGKNILSFQAKIFNRVGEMLYFSQDISKGWDGTYRNKKEPSNTYQYLVHIIYTDLSERRYEGSLQLFR